MVLKLLIDKFANKFKINIKDEKNRIRISFSWANICWM